MLPLEYSLYLNYYFLFFIFQSFIYIYIFFSYTLCQYISCTALSVWWGPIGVFLLFFLLLWETDQRKHCKVDVREGFVYVLSCHFYYNMSCCGPVWVQLVWGPLCFLYLSFRFGKFSAIISSNIFSIPFSFSSPSGIPIMHRLAFFVLSHSSLMLLSCFFHLGFCLLSRLSDCHCSIFHITNSFLCIIHSGLYCL